MMKKTYYPHKKPTGTSTPCHPQDLILVNEGVQCANCLALVVKNEWVEEDDYEPHPFSGENFD